MSNESIYINIIKAKNGTDIPVFSNGRTVDSKYNPERESENIVNGLPPFNQFFIVLGIGSGTLIETLSNKYSQSKILCIEVSNNDIDYLLNLEKVKKLSYNKNIVFSSIDEIEEQLIKNYLPGIFGECRIINQRGWLEENKKYINIINSKINSAIGIISADYSVQCHFGKIWQSNIINNLKCISKGNNYSPIKIDKSKTALIVAAGPSLDSIISKIKENRNNYFIIATDTAYKILNEEQITTDIVVSIDGQHISHNHFMKNTNKSTIFMLDLCCDYSTVQYLSKLNCKIFHFISGHPLSTFANDFSENKFPILFSGAGTVTITALDLAIKLGFRNIKLIGADFSFLKGKSYSKGTYFDTIYNIDNCKIENNENKFNKLMFRTELKQNKEQNYTTDILEAYKLSMEDYLTSNNCDFSKKNDIYHITNNVNDLSEFHITSQHFEYENFINKLSKMPLTVLYMPLLPYIAWLRNQNKNKSFDFYDLLKLAQSHIVRYN